MPLDGDLPTEQGFQYATRRAVTPPGRASKASGRLGLPRLLSLAFFVLACIALQPAAAQEITLSGTSVQEDAGSHSMRWRLSGGSLAAPSTLNLTLNLAVTSGSGAGAALLGTDLTSTAPASVEVSASSHDTLLSVATIINNNVVDGDKTFTVTLSLPDGTDLPAGVTIGPSSSGDGTSYSQTVTIIDEDFAQVSLLPIARASEGALMAFTAGLSVAVAEQFSVMWIANDGTADVDLDLAETEGRVTFPANTTLVTFSIPVAVDQLEEDDETFTLLLGQQSIQGLVNIDAGQIFLSPASFTTGATGTIVDGPAEAPTVDVLDRDFDEDIGLGFFTVSLTAAVDSDVVLDVAITAGTAALTDLGTLPTTVAIDRGDIFARIQVPIVDDAIVEAIEETFTVTLTANSASPLPDGVVIGDGVAEGTIIDDDEAEVTLTPAEQTAGENGTFAYTVNLSAPVYAAVGITWTATTAPGDTATVGDDLRGALTDTVSFAANNVTGQTFTIAVAADDAVEDDETFTVTLTPTSTLPAGVTIPNATSTATITDNDEAPPLPPASLPPPLPPVSLPPTPPPVSLPPATGPTVSIADARADEDDGNATFTVTLSRAVNSNVVLDIAYAAGSADPATDLRAGRPGVVAVAANDTTATFNVPITNDAIVEGDETFTVTVAVSTASAATGSTVADGTAEGTIVDDDGSVVALSPATQTADEDGSFAYTVSISAAADEAIGITWIASAESGGSAESATVAEDLRSATGTVTFPAGTTAAQTFTIAVADDDIAEADETFTVTLTPTGVLPAGVMIATAATSTATITDNDDPSLVDIGDADVDEDAGNATFTVTLSEAVDGNVVLDIAYAAGSADPATDLGTGRPVTVTIRANRTSATFDVPIEDDAIVEGEETFEVIVTVNTPPRVVAIADGTAQGTIADNDRALVTLTPPTQTAGEDGSFSYTVDLSAAVAEAVAITWTASAESGGSAESATVADDLRSATGTVTFPANTTAARTFTITVVDDDAPEADETFTVTLSAVGTLSARVTVDEGNATSTATITDNDTPASASIADAAAAEGAGNVTFTVTLSEAVDSAAVFDIAYAAGSADLTTDLGAGRPATVTIAANSISATFNVPIIDDDVFEADETFTVTLSGNNLPASVDIGTATATGTISNDDFTSILAEARCSAAMSALRRHTGRFERLTGNAVHSRLRGQSPNNGGGVSDGAASGSVARGFDFGEGLNGWLDGSYAGFDGDSEGRQVDLYVGADHLGATGQMVWGVMLGIESAQLDVGVSEYEANHLQIGVYGGALLTDTLIWDGAISYGTGTPDISGQGISADYDAQRFSIRSDLTGGAHALLASGALTVAPQVGVSYVRESLGSFVDSAGGRASEEVLELGRIGAGPRFAWRLDETRELVSSARFQWDMLRDDEDDDTALSGAVDVGARFNPTPELAIGIYVEADGIGNSDKYAAYGGRFELRAVF